MTTLSSKTQCLLSPLCHFLTHITSFANGHVCGSKSEWFRLRLGSRATQHICLLKIPQKTFVRETKGPGNTWSKSLSLTVTIMTERCCSRYLDARGSDCTVCIFNVGQEYSQPVLTLPAKVFSCDCSCDPHQIFFTWPQKTGSSRLFLSQEEPVHCSANVHKYNE